MQNDGAASHAFCSAEAAVTSQLYHSNTQKLMLPRPRESTSSMHLWPKKLSKSDSIAFNFYPGGK
jgi:hypothetical protein